MQALRLPHLGIIRIHASEASTVSIILYFDSNGEIYCSQFSAKLALRANPELRMFRHSLSMPGTRIEDVTDAFLARQAGGSAPTTTPVEQQRG